MKKGPRDVVNISWATGMFFLLFLFHFHFANKLFRYFIILLSTPMRMTKQWSQPAPATTVPSPCSQGGLWVHNNEPTMGTTTTQREDWQWQWQWVREMGVMPQLLQAPAHRVGDDDKWWEREEMVMRWRKTTTRGETTMRGRVRPRRHASPGPFIFFFSLACNPPHAYEHLLIRWFENGS
jgi:hypothetical protein